MKISLSRLSVVLFTLITGLIALGQEADLSHPVKVVIALVGASLLYLIHPAEGGVVPSKSEGPPYQTSAPAAAPAPPVQSLP